MIGGAFGGGGGRGGGGIVSPTTGADFLGPIAPPSLMMSRPPNVVVMTSSRKYGVSDW